MSDNNTNALSGSMNDQAAPSEADMAQRLQSSTQAKSTSLNTATGKNQAQTQNSVKSGTKGPGG